MSKDTKLICRCGESDFESKTQPAISRIFLQCNNCGRWYELSELIYLNKNKKKKKVELENTEVKMKIENGVVKCASQICNKISCPNYYKCETVDLKDIDYQNRHYIK